MTLEEFESLVNRHDLTYDYSDDHAVWERGQASYNRIKAAAKEFPREDVARIWNAMVDRTLVPEAAREYYWEG